MSHLDIGFEKSDALIDVMHHCHNILALCWVHKDKMKYPKSNKSDEGKTRYQISITSLTFNVKIKNELYMLAI